MKKRSTLLYLLFTPVIANAQNTGIGTLAPLKIIPSILITATEEE